MRNFFLNTPHLTKNQQGQAIVEYALTLMMVAGLAISLSVAFRQSAGNVWKVVATEIAAPCHGCKVPDEEASMIEGVQF